MKKQANQALEGLTIVELGNFISAAYCTKLMADLGAQVIKVEQPGTGDEARSYGPFPDGQRDMERSGLFLHLNTNKFGITLDVRTKPGREILLALLKDADILVENNPPAMMDELSLDYDSLKVINRDLIMTSITPFGQTGPYRDYKAYALNSAAAGGVSLSAGLPGREPIAPPVSIGHYQSGTLAATTTLAALLARPMLGRGQHIDISEAEMWATLHTGVMMHGYVVQNLKKMRTGYRTPGLFPNGILPCKDGYISLVTIKGTHWKRFLELTGDGKIPDWYANNPSYMGTYLRDVAAKYADEIEFSLSSWLMDHTKEEIFALCRERDIPVAPVRTTDEVVNSAHLRERGYFVSVDHPVAGRFDYPGPPCRFSKSPWQVVRPAPCLGQHNRDFYQGRLGYSDDRLAELEAAEVI